MKNESERGAIPERLSEAEVQEIVKRLNDPRLRGDEDGEHFTVEAGGEKTYFIAKRRFIPLVENGTVKLIKIEEYLRDFLQQLESQ